jgi:hypothetical protein
MERQANRAAHKAEEPPNKWQEDESARHGAEIVAQLTSGQGVAGKRRAESIMRPTRMEQGGRKHMILGEGQDAEEWR